MATTNLSRAPRFTQIRSINPAAADNPTINDANYPLASSFDPVARRPYIGVYWDADDEVDTDSLDLQILIRDGSLVTAAWIEGDVVESVQPRQVVKFSTYGSSFCYIRVVGLATASTVANVVIRAVASDG